MNKDQVKGALKDAHGKSQKQDEKLIGSRDQEAKGLARQGEAKVQNAYSNVKEALKNSRHE